MRRLIARYRRLQQWLLLRQVRDRMNELRDAERAAWDTIHRSTEERLRLARKLALLEHGA